MTFVVYFDQGLGAAHSKHWLKYVFHIFYIKKIKIRKMGKMGKMCFGEFHPNSGQYGYVTLRLGVAPKHW